MILITAGKSQQSKIFIFGTAEQQSHSFKGYHRLEKLQLAHHSKSLLTKHSLPTLCPSK